MKASRPETLVVYTVGHSTRPLTEFIGLLQGFSVELVADVRTVPRSRRNPQFNRETLHRELAAAGLGYVHLPRLGGLRHPKADSPNLGWRNPSFRGFADYLGTPEFEAGLAELMELARERRTSLMCAEALPWRCHRSLIADALTVRGVTVEHLLGPGRAEPHRLTPFARVKAGRLTYPPEAAEQGDSA
jgi:uncharacterized protein (DUF488 family)